MNSLHLCIALGPVAIYLLVLGLINLTQRPVVTSGARDTAALGLAVSGLAIAGPMELFFPEAAAMHLGPSVWLLLIGFYALCLTLLILLMRPRLVIYNITLDQLRAILADVVPEIDRDARWVGDSLVMPRLQVQLHVEPFSPMKNIQLVSAGPRQSYAGWQRLEDALVPALRKVKGSFNPYGLSMMMFGLLVAGLIALAMISSGPAVAVQWDEMLRR